MKLAKLSLDDFKNFNLKSSYIKLINGGVAPTKTSRNVGSASDGPDFIDNCDKTFFANGSSEPDDTVN